MSVLLVYLDEYKLMRLELVVSDAGESVERARNAFHALRRLENYAPDLIVCAEKLEDLPVAEFHREVRGRPHLAETKFIHITRDGEAVISSGVRDITVNGDISAEDLWAGLSTYIGHVMPVKETPEEQVILEAEVRRAKSPGRQLYGSFEVIGAFEIMTNLQQGRKTGLMTMSILGVEAKFFFRDGQIIHAQYLHLEGEQAAQKAVLRADAEAVGSSFTFVPLDSYILTAMPRSIDRPTDRLLLELAVMLDHQRARSER